MVSGLVVSGWLLTRGRSMLTACCITGTVMMKMISSTSMTSTRGVMLISFITSSLSSWVPKAMSGSCLDGWGRADPRTGDIVGMQVMGKAVELGQHRLVAANQGVV